jgi:hypothetical protein
MNCKPKAGPTGSEQQEMDLAVSMEFRISYLFSILIETEKLLYLTKPVISCPFD